MGPKLGGLLIFISLFLLGFFAMSVSVENPAWDFLLVGLVLLVVGSFILGKTRQKQEFQRFRTARKLLGKRRSTQGNEFDDDDGFEGYEDI
jgi:hypothetical protein